MDNRERTGKVEHDDNGVAEKIFPDYGDTSEHDADGLEGNRVTVDPTMADEEVVPAPIEDRDQGRQTESKESPQREQIVPDN